MRGDGPDLGGEVHFRAAIGAGYEFDNGSTLTLSWDHWSNGDTRATNPGLENLSIRYAISLNQRRLSHYKLSTVQAT
ncbi:acyloxyacyl hydrolase [Yoonia sp. R2-816]|uniref:acyloxyacyl hydrolase n=1 Tax=Yoonia sp. R2-816 TaxID=3342638 RepID=UPI00372AB752